MIPIRIVTFEMGCKMPNVDLIFWTCLFAGVGYTLFALLLGGIGHSGGHVGGHSGGHGGFHLGHHGGQSASHGGHQANVEPEAGPSFGAHLMSFLSPMILSIFATGFGAVGLITRALHLSFNMSFGVGVLGGLVMTIGMLRLMDAIYGDSEITSHVHLNELIGMSVEVSTAITKHGTGYVCVESFGSRQSLPARIADPDENENLEIIPRGARVRIKRIEGGTAFVSLSE